MTNSEKGIKTMDGKIMGFTPPDKFTFDLQRFAVITPTRDDVPANAKFSVTKDGITTYYDAANDFSKTYLINATAITIYGDVTLQDDIKDSDKVNATITVEKSAKLDLNGKTLTFDNTVKTGIKIKNSTDSTNPIVFTLTDSSTGETKGKVIGTYDPIGEESDSTTIIKKLAKKSRYDTDHGPLIFVGEKNGDDAKGSTLTVENGVTVESNNGTICGINNANINIKDSTVKSYMSSAIFLGNDNVKNDSSKSTFAGGQKLTVENSELITGVDFNKDTTEEEISGSGDSATITKNGVEITRKKNSNLPAIQVTGNYNNTESANTGLVIDNTLKKVEVTVKGNSVIKFNNDENGLLKNDDGYIGNPTAIYIGGYAKLTVTDNVQVTSGGTGIEMRAGELEVNDNVSIESSAKTYAVRPNSDGSTIFGAAIAISQHTTKQTIKTTIKSGNVTAKGAVALAIENPEGNDDKTSTIEASVEGGTFESTDTTAAAIALSNGDSRVKVSVQDARFVGALVTKNESTSGEETTESPQIHVTGTITVVNPATQTETTYDDKSVTFKEPDQTTGYVVEPDTWVKATGVENTFYFVQRTTTSVAEARATLAPALEADTTEGVEPGTTKPSETELQLSIASGLAFENNKNLELDLTNTTFASLSSAFKTLTVTDEATSNFHGVNIIGNDNITAITGDKGNDTLTAVAEDGVTLNGGDGDDSLVGGSGEDTFVYSAGNDTIENYTYSTDNISVTSSEDLPLPVDFKKATFTGSNFVFNFGDSSLQVNDTSNVALLKSDDTYSYKGHSGGGMDYIAQEGVGISLGAGYTTKNYNGRNRNYKTIDASHVTVTTGIELRANDEDSKLIGASMGGALYGGEGKDYIKSGLTTEANAASIKAILDGGSDGDDTLEGTNFGIETFVYRGGNDSISGYNAARGDLISIRGFNPGEATISKDDGNNKDFILTFDAGTNVLSIAGGASAADDSAISIQSGNRLYTYTKDYVAYNKGITLASDYSGEKFDGADPSNSEYVTINAAAVTSNISIVGNANNNYIVGSSVASATNGNTLAGGKGNDRIDVNERGDKSNYVFEYTEGKDEVFGFNQTNDKLKITAANIKSAKVGNNKLTLTVKKNSDVLTLRGDDDITKVNLKDSGDADYLTKDGYVTTTTTTEPSATTTTTLKLFSSAKGRIELGDDPYKTSNINAVDAKSVEKQSVTLVGGTQGGTFIYATDGNKKRDGFVYGGGKVTIEGYEESKDRIDLNGSTLTSFTVDENDNVNLLLDSDGTNKYISIGSAKGKEVLLRDGSSRSFKKMVFVQSDIRQNKAKNPTMVTVSADATGNNDNDKTTYTVADSVKKVFVTEDLKAAIKIQAGNKNNTVIDASKAGFGVSLSGGKKNDKLIGNNANADTFIYSEGKDIIQGYTSTDNISITGSLADSLGSAKITAGSKSIKFKFTNKNTLTVKANKGESLSGALNINGLGQTYAKNAIAKGGAVSLTSAFSGTFKTVGTKGLDGTMTTVDGSAVSKNLTFKGTADGETLSGGSKKNTFKGGGGKDEFTGGSGKDIFFYAKGDKGETTIANFEFGANKDRLKIASGTIGEITSINGGGVQFAMNSGKKGDTSNIGWFKVTSAYNSSTKQGSQDITASNVAIKANNTYYWFADKDETIGTGDDALTIKAGQLITSDTRVSASDVSGYDIIDLNYSTNLAKSGVAVKVTSKPTPKSGS